MGCLKFYSIYKGENPASKSFGHGEKTNLKRVLGINRAPERVIKRTHHQKKLYFQGQKAQECGRASCDEKWNPNAFLPKTGGSAEPLISSKRRTFSLT